MHNLTTVMRFEIVRTLKKKTFWITALGFPLIFAVIGGIIYFSNKATDDASKDVEKQKFSFVVSDASGVIKPAIVDAMTGHIVSPSDKQKEIDAVKSGSLDGYIYYPSDLTTGTIEVYGKNVDIFTDGRYSGVAQTILSLSASQSTDANVKAALTKSTSVNFTSYRDGAPYDAVKQMILPGVFLVLFYFLIAFFGNQMLTSTTEEKENRVIEMLLTTVEARTLIVGKILSLIILSIIQGFLVIIPVVIAYLLLHDKLNLPSFDLSSLPVDWGSISIGFAVFASSFLLFTGLLVAIGAAVPTAKEAGSFFGMVMILIFGPLYAASLFVSAPDSPFVTFLSLFPFTAPIPLLLRNALGNLQTWEAIVGILILIITAAIITTIAVRTFRYGALEYSRKLSLKEIFSRK
jgi:ABC-2 type transport system permease protein